MHRSTTTILLLLSLLHNTAHAADATINPNGGITTDTTTKQSYDVLPPPVPPAWNGKIGQRTSESKPYWPKEMAPPAGAPNVLLILIDDSGFGATSTFGGPIPTPTFDALADRGLR
jgi:arylsulfatase